MLKFNFILHKNYFIYGILWTRNTKRFERETNQNIRSKKPKQGGGGKIKWRGERSRKNATVIVPEIIHRHVNQMFSDN